LRSPLFFLGCKRPPPSSPLPIETTAILLFDSESNDVDAPDIMQRLVYLALKNSPYRVLDMDETNAKLNKMGFVDGGQLAAINNTKLGQELGVQGLLFGNVESFGYTNVGVYVGRKVNLELRLVDVATGETLWEGEGKASKSKFAFNKEDIQENFTKGLADQLVDKMFKSTLEEEARMATKKALRSLPGFRFAGFARDEKTQGKGIRRTKRTLKKAIEDK